MAQEVSVYIQPSSHHFLGDRLFIVEDGRTNGDRINAPFAHMRDFLAARGIRVQTADYMPKQETSTQKIYISMGWIEDYRQIAKRSDVIMSALFAMECPLVDPALYRELGRAQHFFRRILSWTDSQSIQHLVRGTLKCEHFCWPQSFDDVHDGIWQKTNRKFLVMINSNRVPLLYWNELYSERLRAVEFFSRTGEIDLYGNGWNETPFPMHQKWVPYTFRFMHHAFNRRWDRIRPDPWLTAARKVYRGRAASKADTLGDYTFALCFENMILKGWIPEKIFDCFFAGTIPIYLGAPDILEWVPPECFVDMRKFSGYQELRDFLRSLGEKDIRQYKEAAREYLRSPKFSPFSKQTFAEIFARIVEEDSGIPILSASPANAFAVHQ
jgi:hypothetical protein